jgi:hypothetical protein
MTCFKADRVVVASLDNTGIIQLVDYEEQQQLKQIEDKVLDVVIVLDSTLDTVTSLIEKYTYLKRQMKSQMKRQNDASFEDSSNLPSDSIMFGLREKRREVLLVRKKIDALHAKVQGTMKLVRMTHLTLCFLSHS